MPKNNHPSAQSSNNRLILRPLPQSPSVAVVVMVGTGSRYEPENIGGISHFLEHMVFKGTEKRPNTLDIATTVDGIGGEFNAFTSKEYTGYYIKTAAKDVELAIDLLADMLFHSKFEAEEIERERGVILEEMNMYLDSPRDRVGEIYDHILYPNQVLGQDVIGTRDSLANINRQHLLEYLGQWYAPNNMVIGIVGGFDGAKVESLASQSFFKASKKEVPPFEPATTQQSEPGIISIAKDTDQTHLVLGVRAFSISDPRRYALALLNVVLGGNMSSRLFTQVRERRGLAYAVHTGIDHYLDTGTFNCQVGLDHSRVEETIRVILDQFKQTRDELIPKEELQRAKSYLRGKLSLSLEDPLGLSMYLARQQLLQGRVVSAEDYLKQIDAVTPQDLQVVANEIFQQSKLNLAIISPKPDQVKLKQALAL